MCWSSILQDHLSEIWWICPFLWISFWIFVDTCYGQEWSTQIIGGIIFWSINKTKQEHLVDCVSMQRLALDSWLCFRIKLLNQLITFNLFCLWSWYLCILNNSYLCFFYFEYLDYVFCEKDYLLAYINVWHLICFCSQNQQ